MIRRLATDYLRAVGGAARGGRWHRVPGAAVRVARARFAHGIGPYYYTLFGLDTMPAARWREIILEPESNRLIEGINRGHLRLADDKLAFAAHCIRREIATAPIVAALTDAALPPEVSDARVRTAAELGQRLAAAPDQLFVKPIDGSHGQGAFRLTRDGAGWAFQGRRGDAAEIFRHCSAARRGRGWLIQPALTPHPDLVPIMGRALGTIRAVTYIAGDEARLLLPTVRLPAGDSVIDNFGTGASGNLVAPIDVRTGTLGKGWMSVRGDWPRPMDVAVHPDSGAPVEGAVIPGWDAVVDLVSRAQLATPELPTLGWDVAVTADGPLIIEANPNWGTNILQVAYRRGIRPDLAPVIALRERRPA